MERFGCLLRHLFLPPPSRRFRPYKEDGTAEMEEINFDDLREKFKNYEIHDLLKVIFVDYDDYLQRALTLATDELESRSDFPNLLAEESKRSGEIIHSVQNTEYLQKEREFVYGKLFFTTSGLYFIPQEVSKKYRQSGVPFGAGLLAGIAFSVLEYVISDEDEADRKEINSTSLPLSLFTGLMDFSVDILLENIKSATIGEKDILEVSDSNKTLYRFVVPNTSLPSIKSWLTDNGIEILPPKTLIQKILSLFNRE